MDACAMLLAAGGIWYAMIELHTLYRHVPLIYVAAAMNVILAMLWHWYRRYKTLIQMIHQVMAQWHANQNLSTHMHPRPASALMGELKQIIEHALENHRLQMQLRMQLSAAQHALQQFQSMLSLHGNMQHLFKRIASYTHMLEETIARRASASCLREAFDDLSEQSFNLQLFIAAFERLRKPQAHSVSIDTINPTHTLSRILVPMAGALDRRAMQLSSAAWDERGRAQINAQDLELIAWLMLLGTVHYAETESTLVLSCEPSADGNQTLITCLVTELAPGTMAPHERAAFMSAQQKYQSAHMFAHTLAASTNLTLAKQIAETIGGHLTVHPRTQTSCLVELMLPR